MKKAIKPDFFAHFPSLKQKEEAVKSGASEDEQAFYGMSLTGGWVLFKQEAQRLLDELNELNDQAVSMGQTYEELGKNAVVVSLTKGIISKLLNKVEDSKEACEGGNSGAREA